MSAEYVLGRQCQLFAGDVVRVLALEEDGSAGGSASTSLPSNRVYVPDAAAREWGAASLGWLLRHAVDRMHGDAASQQPPSTAAASALLALWRQTMAVEAAHVRTDLLPGAYVRIKIPKSRRTVLVDNNVDVQDQLKQEEEERRKLQEAENEEKNRQTGTSASDAEKRVPVAGSADTKAEGVHRVGRLQALVPDPSKWAKSSTVSSTSGAATVPSLIALYIHYVSTSAQAQDRQVGDETAPILSFDEWLAGNATDQAVLQKLQQNLLGSCLALVDFGECSETISIKFLSPDRFTRGEFNAHVRSALRRHGAVTGSQGDESPAKPTDTIRANLARSRYFFRRAVNFSPLFLSQDGTVSALALDDSHGGPLGATRSKRPREDEKESEKERVAESARMRYDAVAATLQGVRALELTEFDSALEASAGDAAASSPTGYPSNPLAERAGKGAVAAVAVAAGEGELMYLSAQLESERRSHQRMQGEMGTQLQNLRNIISQKNSEIQMVKNAQRSLEDQWMVERDEWRGKTESQGQRIETLEKDIAKEQESRRESESKVREKLVPIKDKLEKYKSVSDTVARMLKLESSTGFFKPEDVLAALAKHQQLP